MEIQEIIDLCIKDLEKQGLKIGKKLEELKLEHKRISELRELLSKLKTSKISTVYEYQSLSNEDKEAFRRKINSVLHNNSQTDEIICEIENLFFLNKEGLIELEEVTPQKEHIEKILESFINTLEAYIEKFDIADYDKKVQSLSSEMDRIIKLGTTLSTGTYELSIITDIPFFKTVVERLDIGEQDKINFIIYVINHNNEVYTKTIKKKQGKKKTSRKVSALPKEILDEIEVLLNDPTSIERIVKIVNDDFKTQINFKKPSKEHRKIIEESINIARKSIIGNIKNNKSLTPYEALQTFYDEYDNESRRKTIELRELLKDTSKSNLTERKQQNLIRQAYKLRELFEDEKDDSLKEKISKIMYLLDLIESLDSNEEDASILMSKAAKYLEDIFKELKQDDEIDGELEKILGDYEITEEKPKRK